MMRLEVAAIIRTTKTKRLERRRSVALHNLPLGYNKFGSARKVVRSNSPIIAIIDKTTSEEAPW
jgi:hypothetical protein